MTSPATNAATPDLFTPLQMGSLRLRNRMVMAPMTRARSGPEGVPRALNIDYYAQRASAGLIISEGANTSWLARGYAHTPGIFTHRQLEAWRPITDAVHARGGLIFCQLWHVGRASHPVLQLDGALPIAPSAITPATRAYTADRGFIDCIQPHALDLDEIPAVIDEFRHATLMARDAGFDGVELHAAGGYLIDQFLRDNSNHRTDAYGGSIANRTRFLMEATEAAASAWSPDRVGVRLAPVSRVNDTIDSNPEPLFTSAAQQLGTLGLAYLHNIEGQIGGDRTLGFDPQVMRQAFGGLYMANNGYDRDSGQAALAAGTADLIAYGKDFIANPDLVERYRTGAPLNEPVREEYYGGGAKGYTDYPAL